MHKMYRECYILVRTHSRKRYSVYEIIPTTDDNRGHVISLGHTDRTQTHARTHARTHTHTHTQWVKIRSPSSTTLLLPILLSDSHVSISLVIRGLWWTVSGQVKAHAVLTCTNGVLPNHLPEIVASDRPWTTLSVDWIYSTKRMMTHSYGWNLQQLQHSQNNNKCKDCCWCCMPDMTVTVHLIRLKAAGLEITTLTVEKKHALNWKRYKIQEQHDLILHWTPVQI